MKPAVVAFTLGLALVGTAIIAKEDIMKTTAETTRPFVAAYLVKKKPGMSFEAFRTHQLETHVPLALALPGLIDYRLTFFSPIDGQSQPFDAMAQVTFESGAAHDAALASAQGQAALADLDSMLDMTALSVLLAGQGDFHTARLMAP